MYSFKYFVRLSDKVKLIMRVKSTMLSIVIVFYVTLLVSDGLVVGSEVGGDGLSDEKLFNPYGRRHWCGGGLGHGIYSRGFRHRRFGSGGTGCSGDAGPGGGGATGGGVGGGIGGGAGGGGGIGGGGGAGGGLGGGGDAGGGGGAGGGVGGGVGGGAGGGLGGGGGAGGGAGGGVGSGGGGGLGGGGGTGGGLGGGIGGGGGAGGGVGGGGAGGGVGGGGGAGVDLAVGVVLVAEQGAAVEELVVEVDSAEVVAAVSEVAGV